ncbi:hypothetical protein AV654_30250 [Paenibacillus elgii]|uniref:Uncharacterized protein n=1 Tax=Paenibacillus elgii TaxID=189691 RepID=A0A165QAK8_9BACL|nr:hypothetical protein AV654_30250 [Paenibacillus elgii]
MEEIGSNVIIGGGFEQMWIRTCQVQIDELTQFMEEGGSGADRRDETALSFGISLQAAAAEGICS